MEPNIPVQVEQKHFINRVTPFSKTLAVVVFVALPILTLYIGYQKGSKVAHPLESASNHQVEKTVESSNSRDGFSGKLNILSVNTATGSVPLEVTFSIGDGWGLGTIWIDFGDGSKELVSCKKSKPDTDGCSELGPVTHTYTTPGTYLATYNISNFPEKGPVETWDSVLITVNSFIQ